VLLAVLLPACDNGITLLNVVPEVTAVGPLTWDPDTKTATLTVWLRDHEAQAVDLNVEVIADGQATPIVAMGGHGLVGLTTAADAPGVAHILKWSPDSLSDSAKLTLRLTAIDSEGDTGPAFETPGFTLVAGLPQPQ